MNHLTSMAGFAQGANLVPADMVAQIHAGERIIPKADNSKLLAAVDRGTGGRGGSNGSERCVQKVTSDDPHPATGLAQLMAGAAFGQAALLVDQGLVPATDVAAMLDVSALGLEEIETRPGNTRAATYRIAREKIEAFAALLPTIERQGAERRARGTAGATAAWAKGGSDPQERP